MIRILIESRESYEKYRYLYYGEDGFEYIDDFYDNLVDSYGFENVYSNADKTDNTIQVHIITNEFFIEVNTRVAKIGNNKYKAMHTIYLFNYSSYDKIYKHFSNFDDFSDMVFNVLDYMKNRPDDVDVVYNDLSNFGFNIKYKDW